VADAILDPNHHKYDGDSNELLTFDDELLVRGKGISCTNVHIRSDTGHLRLVRWKVGSDESCVHGREG
jgi:hypothetical protein